jgi:DNA-binding LacI/PurR family transcriptional regulator
MVTLVDVARLAMVTTATVSNVINGKGAVSEKTRKRVEAAIQELGYRPNLVARGLARGRTNMLALVLHTLSNPFYSEFAEEVELIAWKRGYHVLLCTTLQKELTIPGHMLERLSSRLIDGLLLTSGTFSLKEAQQAMERGLAVVLYMDWEGADPEQIKQFPAVDFDLFSAGELAAAHLVELGHRRCAVILEMPNHLRRLNGFRAGLASAGIELDADSIQHCSKDTIQQGYQATTALLALPRRPTAIFASNDMLAIGALHAITDHELRVPDDISIVGLDDNLMASQVSPALTTIALPKHELAHIGIEMLQQAIEGEEPVGVHHHRLVQPHLVVRRSTAPPPPDV